ncbi:MAG TPA: DUF2264 domain-containing protein [Opitutaceae bacterium]|nr:DUF2264 domain-containing protein [Opitutaceae bacterium]
MQIPRRQFLKLTALASTGTLMTRPTLAASAVSPLATPPPPDAYRRWQSHARTLLEPLARLFAPGKAGLPIHGPASANGANSDRLETFARPLLLAAHYLQSVPETDDASAGPFRDRVADWFRRALVIGSTPGGPEAWGPDANYHQIHVEMGLLCVALQIAPEHLWTPLSQSERDQVARWLATARHTGYVDNNHYFMGLHVLEFLRAQGYGRRTDAALVDTYFDRLERMHRGGGWFQDGINQAFDYYNAYAFNFYGLWWARLHGAQNPARAQRWRDYARTFTRDYEHFFAASGEHPAFGRSITYRFCAVATFGLTVLEHCTDLPLGRIRRLCTRNLEFFLRQPIYQDQGCLTLGWLDRFDASAEIYSDAGSPYWAAKGFSPLLLPPSHPFWTVPEEPLASERGDYARVIAPAGIVVRSARGDVELINAGSQVSNTNLRYGAWKWSKTAYRTGVSFTCAFPTQTNWSPDSALTIRLPDGRVFGRHSTVATELAETHVGYSWALGYAPEQINVGVDTLVWWRGDWLLQLHRLNALQPVELRLGGYALPLTEPTCIRSSGPKLLVAWDSAHRQGTALQPLHGFDATDWDARLDETSPRAHLATHYHVTPLALRRQVVGVEFAAALTWTGTAEHAPEVAPWTLESAQAGTWRLRHPQLGIWEVRHDALPDLNPLNRE